MGKPTSPNVSLQRITRIVETFLGQARNAGHPVFAVVSAYQESGGEWRIRTMLNADDSAQAVDAIYALISLLTPEDLEMLLTKIRNEHPEVKLFRELRKPSPNGWMN